MPNVFTNVNVILWYRWIFRRKSHSKAVVLYFLSRRYGTSPRFFPLYNEFHRTDIVLFNGSRFPGFDRMYLKALPHFIRVFKWKLQKYPFFISLNSDPSLTVRTNTILNLDDPTYKESEILQLIAWEKAVARLGYKSTIVCTTPYIENYLLSHEISSTIKIISQGHSNSGSAGSRSDRKESSFVDFVYISPTIDVTGDPHEGHKMWDASTLLHEIWPLVEAPNARLHLIGRLGQKASLIQEDRRVITYGLLTIEECSKLLPKFQIALYPRIHDNAWLPQKLVEYLGAGLPVLAFDLTDTQIVQDLGIGLLVKSVQEFSLTIDRIATKKIDTDTFRSNCLNLSGSYTWHALAAKFESLYS